MSLLFSWEIIILKLTELHLFVYPKTHTDAGIDIVRVALFYICLFPQTLLQTVFNGSYSYNVADSSYKGTVRPTESPPTFHTLY